MRKYFINCIMLMSVFSLCFLTSCAGNRNKEPEQIVELVDDSWIMERYFQEMEGYNTIQYERVYYDWKDRLAVGPTDYRYRGVIYFTEEQASALWDQYEWVQVTDVPDFVFEKVNVESIGNGPWYGCKQFEKDNLSTVNVFYVAYDGNVLVFDFQQY